MTRIRLFKSSAEHGLSLIEVLVGLSILSIVGLGLVQSSIVSLNMRHKTENDAMAAQIALEKLEGFAAVDPADYSDGESWTESVTRSNRNFTRESSVTVNADESRTFTVSITSDNFAMGGNVSMSNTYSPWGMH
ncbi:prepilin-type N-terminal cleavage/methylation domain-containing protein [Oligoflexia bacterium]|nr:prepilin-type N-terminal cleavage/methylation domain-containing protein [Oligoflexia bacterium]